MSQRRSKRRHISEEEDDEEEQVPPPPRRRVQAKTEAFEEVEDEEEEEEANYDFGFSQQAPEASQSVLPERAAERRKLESMDRAARERSVLSLSRMILFRALDREPLDRLKLAKDSGIASDRITSAAYQEAASRLRNVFGFELKRIPKYMEKIKGIPAKCKDRMYVVNGISEGPDGSHSKAIHSIHQASSIERGLLILVLSLIFCKGECRSDGSRWILSRELYRLLHNIDDSIPDEPPAQGTARAKAACQQKIGRFNNENLTPNVDALLEQFVYSDYLIREKATEDNFSSQTLEEGDILYSMGPRSAMEVGRKQIIHFCAEILDEEPDPTMLKEVEEDIEEEEEEEEEEAVEIYMEEVSQ